MHALMLQHRHQEAAMACDPSLHSGPGSPHRGMFRRQSVAWALALLGALLGPAAHAEDAASLTPAEARAVIAKLEGHKAALARANAAVVGVEAVAIEDARSI